MYIRLVFPVVFPNYNIEIREIKTRTDTISTMWSMLSMCDSISSSISMRVIKNIQELTHEK